MMRRLLGDRNLVCTIDFAKVPAGKRLDISNVSCYVRINVDAYLYAMQLLVPGSAVTLVPAFVGSIQSCKSDRVYSANHAIFAFVPAGKKPQAYVELKAGAIRQLACHISGQLLP